jgi:predicted flap endonuclease-1-like 5' DNA nuclease
MWFLLLQIFLLLLLAAALGAATMWWWLRRRYEDVTETHDLFVRKSGQTDALADKATRDDLAASTGQIVSAISGIKAPDLSPVETRLGRLEQTLAGLRLPPVEERLGRVEQALGALRLSPVEERLGRVEQALGAWRAPLESRLHRIEEAVGAIRIPQTDFAPVNRQLEMIGQHMRGPNLAIDQLRTRLASMEEGIVTMSKSVTALSNADLKPVESRLSAMEDIMRRWKPPEVDLGPVHSGIVTLQLGIEELKTRASSDSMRVQIGALETRLAALGERLEGSRRSDIESLTQRLAAVSGGLQQAVAGIVIPPMDLTSIEKRLDDLDIGLSVLDRPPPDLQPLHARLTALESQLTAVQLEVRDRRPLQKLERSIAGLEEAMASQPGVDFSPVMETVLSLDSRQDLVAVENRLTSIEYSVTALHHMLRSRPEGSLTRTTSEWQVRPGATHATGATNGEAKTAAQIAVIPPRDVDPINPVRKPGDQANLLVEPAFGPADNLELINGVGPHLRDLLNEVGVFYFWQVAEWTPDDINWVDSRLRHFRGRIKREDWVGHARTLSEAPNSARRPQAAAARSPL